MSTHEIGVVHTTIKRPDPDLVAQLSGFGVATVHEAMGRVGLMRHSREPRTSVPLRPQHVPPQAREL